MKTNPAEIRNSTMVSSKSKKFTTQTLKSRQSFAFTLVELLVVIGIIAVLIGILLPSLASAREASRRAACAAKLQQIMVAANICAVDHKGYFPLAGLLVSNTNAADASCLDDTYRQKYSYEAVDPADGYGPYILAPITFALGEEMGFKKNLGAAKEADQIQADTDRTGVIRHFLCPSQANGIEELPQYCFLNFGNIAGYGEQLSYIFNEAVLGFDDAHFRLRGEVVRIRQSSKTFFCCDGLGSAAKTRGTDQYKLINFGPGVPTGPYPWLTMYNQSTINHTITMNDALIQTLDKNGGINAGDAGNFDQVRHKGKMNIAFCDGHVELRTIPPFKINTAISYVAKFPGNVKPTGLNDVYLLAP